MSISKFSKQFLTATLLFAFAMIVHIQSIQNSEMAKMQSIKKITTQKRIANN